MLPDPQEDIQRPCETRASDPGQGETAMNPDPPNAVPPQPAPTVAPTGGAGAARRRLWIVPLLAIVALAAFVWWRQRSPSPPVVAMDHVDPAVRQAIATARAQVESEPRSALAWGRLGALLMVHDFAEPACSAFAQAARLDPEEPRWPYLHGRALYRAPDQAIPLFETAVRRCRDRPLEPRLKLAELLFELNRLDEAEKALRIAERLAADHPRVQLGLGRIALAREDWLRAAEHLEKAAATPFARQKASALLAAVYRRLPGQGDKALIAAAQAQTPPLDIDFDVLDPFVQEMAGLGVGKNHRLARAENLQVEGKLREAAEVSVALVKDYPDDPWVHLRLAEVLLRGEDWRGAASAARQALARDPQAAQAHFFFAVALFHGGDAPDTDAVVTALRRTVELNPSHGYAYNYLGQALRRSGRGAEALAAFRAASRCYPAFADPHLHLADLWMEFGLLAPASLHVQYARRFTPPQDRRLQETAARFMVSLALRGGLPW
jgi:cytochrome c-type biogenesis protein CcmH/NrfG